MFFSDDKIIYDLLQHQEIQLSESVVGLDQLYDLQVSPTTLEVLYEQGTSLTLCTLQRNGYALINTRQLFDRKHGSLLNGIKSKPERTEDIDLNPSSNLVLSGSNIYFINQSGKIVHISL